MSKSPLLIAATRWEISPSLYPLANVEPHGQSTWGDILSEATVQSLSKDRGLSRRVKLIRCGIGAPHIRRLIDPSLQGPLVSIGFAGGVHESLRPNDILLTNESLQIVHNGTWRTLEHLVFPELQFRSFHDTFFESSRIVWGKLGTVPRVVVMPWAKRNLGDSRAVCAIDMESFAIAQLAEEYKLPWIGIRIILDAVNEPLLGWRPWEFPKRVFRARETLGRFLAEKLWELL